MTKDQIIAELRRSAVEDVDPWHGVKFDAFDAACNFKEVYKLMERLSRDDLRTFFLLVAEALESSNAR